MIRFGGTGASSRRRPVLSGAAAVVACAITIAAFGVQPAAQAGTPSSVTLSPGQSVTYTGDPVAGWPDPTGMPAPVCSPGMCDHETVNLQVPSSISTPPYDVTLSITVNYTPSDPLGFNCLDVGILDASGNVLVSQGCVPPGTKVTANGVKAGTYTVEVDGDNQAGVAAPAQPYDGTVASTATVISEPTYLGGPAAYHGTVVAGPDPAVAPQNQPVRSSGQPLVLRAHFVGREAAEPSIGVDRTGAVFFPASTFDSPGGVLARTEYLRSTDQGTSWVNVSPTVAGFETHPGSLDPMLWLDKTSGRVFAVDTLAVQASLLSYTDDQGANWTNSAAMAAAVNDHQTITTGVVPAGSPLVTLDPAMPKIVYYCVNTVVAVSCSRSLDGGRTFTQMNSPFPTHTLPPGSPLCSSLTGHLATDPAGRLFLPSAFNSPACSGQLMVATSTDAGNTWTQSVVSANIPDAIHDGSIASDSAGNLYVVWQDAKHELPYLSISRDHGQTWSTPLMIAPPGVHEVNFPSIDAGDPGRIVVTFPGTTSNDSSDPLRPWSYFVVTSTTALSSNPLFVSNVAIIPGTGSPIMQRGDCTGRCGGLFDFLDVVVAPTAGGPAWASLSDDCTGACVSNPLGKSDDPTVGQGLAVQEVCGPALLGTQLWLTGKKRACPSP